MTVNGTMSSSSSVASTATSESSSIASYFINQSIDLELHSLPAPLGALRGWLLAHVHRGNDVVAAFQSLCGVDVIEASAQQSIDIGQPVDKLRSHNSSIRSSSTQRYRVRRPFVYAYFQLAAGMGNEIFYILCLPAINWLISTMLLRRLIVAWLTSYYVGQFLKDLLQLPRPVSPMIVKLENHYETEFGFPSTHAMISLTLPVVVVAFIHELNQSVSQSDQISLIAPCFLACVWVISIAASRLYNGVHSLVDIIGGFVLALSIIVPVVALSKSFDLWLLRAEPHSISLVLLCSWLLVAIYPRPKRWTNCFGDTTIIVGVATGVFVAVLSSQQVRDRQALAATHSILTSEFWMLALLRLIIGFASLFAIRATFKKVSYSVLPHLLFKNFDSKSQIYFQPDRTYLTEIPTKWLVYGAVGFGTISVIPALFAFLHI